MSYTKISIFLLTLVFTFILRAHNYEKTPVSNHLDEMLYAWSGLYLIETGTPVSWSTLDYPKRALVFKGEVNYKGGEPSTNVDMYKPWLDEPPLFSLIVGYFAHINGAQRTEFVPSSYIRIPTVIFGALTSIFVFLIARLVSGYWTGILAMLVYGTVPVMVFSSRTAMPENFIALLYTIIGYLLLKFYKSPKNIFLYPLPVLVGIAGLSKPTGFFLIFVILYLVFAKVYELENFKAALKKVIYLFLGVVPFVLLFILYGLHYDQEIFWRIMKIQSFRPVGFGSLGWFFISPAYRTAILKDGWYIFCLLSAAYFLFSPKEGLKKLISIFFIFWVGVVMVSGGEGDLLPWYRYPVFPFLAILGAWGLQLIVKRADIFASFLGAGLLLSSRSLLVNAFRSNIHPEQYRNMMILLLTPSILHSIFNTERLKNIAKLTLIGIITVGMYFNAQYIYSEYDITCENITCPFVPTTSLSTLHFPIIWRFFAVTAK